MACVCDQGNDGVVPNIRDQCRYREDLNMLTRAGAMNGLNASGAKEKSLSELAWLLRLMASRVRVRSNVLSLTS